MTIATIDLGTNTLLMVVGSMELNGEIQVFADEHEVGRLGKGVDETGLILPETFDRIAKILKQYHQIAHEHGAEQIIGFGTSALRDARNRDLFIKTMKERTGVELQLLSGTDEARLTFQGALFGLEVDDKDIAVIDIGGGSTEVAQGSKKEFQQGVSVDVGAVRVTERFFQGTLPPPTMAIAEARAFIRSAFLETLVLPSKRAVVGVAGTVTTLGALFNSVKNFDSETINGIKLSKKWIHDTTEHLIKLSLGEIREVPQIMPGRADIITGGALVLDEFMQTFDVEEIVVSTRGLRYGLLTQQLCQERGTLTSNF